MALSKKIILDNGVEYNIFKVGIIQADISTGIKVVLDCFRNETVYDLYKERHQLLDEQETLLTKFNKLESREELTNKEKEKLAELQNEINSKADRINEIGPDNELIAGTLEITIPYVENLSVANIQKELTKVGELKLAKIIK